MSYDHWKTTEPDEWIDWPCVKHKRKKPCCLCEDDEADYKLEEWLESQGRTIEQDEL